jgi:hypothetical protein
LLSIWPSPSSPGPYIYAARSQGTWVVRYILQHRYTTWTRISTRITLGPSLTGLRGTQVTGSIIYTLVRGWIGDLKLLRVAWQMRTKTNV